MAENSEIAEKHKIQGELLVQSTAPCGDEDFLNKRLLGWPPTWFSNPKGAIPDREGPDPSLEWS